MYEAKRGWSVETEQTAHPRNPEVHCLKLRRPSRLLWRIRAVPARVPFWNLSILRFFAHDFTLLQRAATTYHAVEELFVLAANNSVAFLGTEYSVAWYGVFNGHDKFSLELHPTLCRCADRRFRREARRGWRIHNICWRGGGVDRRAKWILPEWS